jgi:hypothetical protein
MCMVDAPPSPLSPPGAQAVLLDWAQDWAQGARGPGTHSGRAPAGLRGPLSYEKPACLIFPFLKACGTLFPFSTRHRR